MTTNEPTYTPVPRATLNATAKDHESRAQFGISVPDAFELGDYLIVVVANGLRMMLEDEYCSPNVGFVGRMFGVPEGTPLDSYDDLVDWDAAATAWREEIASHASVLRPTLQVVIGGLRSWSMSTAVSSPPTSRPASTGLRRTGWVCGPKTSLTTSCAGERRVGVAPRGA
jgi:hypothetical protein